MRVSSWSIVIFSVGGSKSKIPRHGYNEKRRKKKQRLQAKQQQKKYAVAIATDNLDEAKKYSGLLCGWHV